MFIKFLFMRRKSILKIFDRTINRLIKLNNIIDNSIDDKIQDIKSLYDEKDQLEELKRQNNNTLEKITKIVGD
jgi:hypothetical protein